MDEIKTRFVAFGLARSGTTFLIRLLDSHQQVLCMGEILNPVSSTCHPILPIPRYQLYLEQSAKRRLISRIAGDYALRQYLNWVFETYRSEAVCFKLMLDQLQYFPSVAEYMQEEQFKIIYIFRENVLKLHVSHVRAQLTDVWVSKEPVGQTQVNIPVRNLFDTLERLENQQRQQSEMIRRMQLPHIELVYERLAQDYRQELLPVLDFLGVDNEVGLKTELRKITSDDLGQVIENYQEVADTLTSTKYEQYLT